MLVFQLSYIKIHLVYLKNLLIYDIILLYIIYSEYRNRTLTFKGGKDLRINGLL